MGGGGLGHTPLRGLRRGERGMTGRETTRLNSVCFCSGCVDLAVGEERARGCGCTGDPGVYVTCPLYFLFVSLFILGVLFEYLKESLCLMACLCLVLLPERRIWGRRGVNGKALCVLMAAGRGMLGRTGASLGYLRVKHWVHYSTGPAPPSLHPHANKNW